ncbi:MAG: DUF1499 domain-containing protein [Pseudomonadota bacterium]
MKVLKTLFFVVFGLAVIAVGGFAYLGQTSKSGKALGLTQGQLVPCPASPNCVSSEAGTEPDKRVEAFALGAWGRLPAAIAEMGGTIIVSDEDYIAAEFTSSTFGFVDDVEFRLAEDAVQARSASRVGYSDAGVNAARIEELRSKVAQ